MMIETVAYNVARELAEGEDFLFVDRDDSLGVFGVWRCEE